MQKKSQLVLHLRNRAILRILFLPRDFNTHGMVHYAEFGAHFLKLRDVSLGVDRTVLTSLALPKAMHAHTTVAGVARQSRLRGKRAIFSVYHEK